MTALAATLYAAIVLAAIHVGRADIDPTFQPISAYGLGPSARWFSTALIAWGTSGWLLAAAVSQRGSRSARPLLWVFGAGLMIAGAFRMDVPFPPTEWTIRALSWRGLVHIAGASISSLTFPIAALMLTAALPHARWLRTSAVASALACAAVFLLPLTDVRWFGLAQRALAVSIFAWQLPVELSLVKNHAARCL